MCLPSDLQHLIPQFSVPLYLKLDFIPTLQIART